MRILVVSNLYPDARQPAFGTFVASHAESLKRAGAEVEVVAIHGYAAHQAVLRKYLGFTVRVVWRALVDRLRRTTPDIVEAHVAYPTALLAWMAARLSGAALVVFAHGSDVTLERRGLARRLARIAFTCGDLVIGNSRFLRQELLARYPVDPKRVIVRSPGIDRQRFINRPAVADRHGVLFVGRMARSKGVHELLTAYASLQPRPGLRLLGTGPDEDMFMHEAETLGIDADFGGAATPTEVAAAMQRALVVAMPSIYPEGLGLVAIEAMAAGAMVVASDIGGLPEVVVEGETGWLVRPGDSHELTSALRSALELATARPDEYRAMQHRAARKAYRHDIDRIAAITLRSYRSVVDGAC